MVLFLSDVSGSEVLLILLFILIFFGSKSIPSLARTLGRTMRQIKDASQDLQDEIRKSGADIKKDLNFDQLNLNRMIEETAEDVQRPVRNAFVEMENAIHFDPPRKMDQPAEEIPVEPLPVTAIPEAETVAPVPNPVVPPVSEPVAEAVKVQPGTENPQV
jgi:sec-independent protein translocase protein TatA